MALAPELRNEVVGQCERRRVLEQATDIFAGLAFLHERGVTLDGRIFQTDWEASLSTDDAQEENIYLLPGYLWPSSPSINPFHIFPLIHIYKSTKS